MRPEEERFVSSTIYQTLQQRCLALTLANPRATVCPVSAEELEALEEAAPPWKRFLTKDGNFTCDPLWGWEFKVQA